MVYYRLFHSQCPWQWWLTTRCIHCINRIWHHCFIPVTPQRHHKVTILPRQVMATMSQNGSHLPEVLMVVLEMMSTMRCIIDPSTHIQWRTCHSIWNLLKAFIVLIRIFIDTTRLPLYTLPPPINLPSITCIRMLQPTFKLCATWPTSGELSGLTINMHAWKPSN